MLFVENEQVTTLVVEAEGKEECEPKKPEIQNRLTRSRRNNVKKRKKSDTPKPRPRVKCPREASPAPIQVLSGETPETTPSTQPDPMGKENEVPTDSPSEESAEEAE